MTHLHIRFQAIQTNAILVKIGIDPCQSFVQIKATKFSQYHRRNTLTQKFKSTLDLIKHFGLRMFFFLISWQKRKKIGTKNAIVWECFCDVS